jgi:hypothetical protein
MSSTTTVVFFSVLLLAFAIVFAVRARREPRIAIAKSGLPASPSKATPLEVYLGLRDLILKGNREKFHLAAVSSPLEPWGVVMDWRVAQGTSTIVALSDGNASIYLSSGGGFIGGQSHESIRNAAQGTVAAAAEIQALSKATTIFPSPTQGTVIFYLLTDAGVFSVTASEEDLRQHRHPLSKLGDACQRIITEYRLLKS